MILFKNFLNSIAYYYYPKGLHETSSSYVNTQEHKNYLILHKNWSLLKSTLDPVIEKIKSSGINKSNIKINGTANNTPCYEIELLLKSTKKAKTVIIIYVSLFIPFYHIVMLTENKLNAQIKPTLEIPEYLEVKISEILNQKLKYQKFPNNLLYCRIPRLEVYSDFNYMTAFFTDGYRIAHF